MTEANKTQIGGTHYKRLPIEHWDLVVLYSWDYFQAQITRYMMRWKTKDGIKDLEKMAHTAQKYVEIEKLRATGNLTLEILRGALAKLEQELAEDAAEDTNFALDPGESTPQDITRESIVRSLQDDLNGDRPTIFDAKMQMPPAPIFNTRFWTCDADGATLDYQLRIRYATIEDMQSAHGWFTDQMRLLQVQPNTAGLQPSKPWPRR